MSSGKPKNLLRTTLGVVGVLLYRVGLANAVIGMSKKRVRAMLYHAVEAENSNSYTKGLNVGVTTATFEANLDYYKKHYNVVPVSQLATQELPAKPLVITFDDGYRSVYENAVPALQARELSACVYLISRAVRGELVWVNLVNQALSQYPERLSTLLKQIPVTSELELNQVIGHFDINAEGLYATPEEILEMRNKGIEFGFHTADHFNLSRCNSEELTEQLDPSEVAELTNNNTFAYPFGYYSQSAIDHLTEQKLSTIMTVGNNHKQTSELHLDRTELFTADPAQLFAQLEVVEPIIAMLRTKLGKPPVQAAA